MNVSFSRYSTFMKCPERYRLERIVGVEEKPNVWLPAGTNIGLACDHLDTHGDLEKARQVFLDGMEVDLRRMEADYSTSREEFETTGKTKDRPTGRDQDWWADNVGNMLEKYHDWRLGSGYSLAEVDGDRLKSIELEISLDLGNGTVLRGFADRLFERPDGRLIVVDLKSGQTQPGIYQLATYAYAIRETYGLEVEYGSFYMLAKDGESKPQRLTTYTQGNTVQQTYRRLDVAIKAGAFVPNIGSDCFRCPVAKACRFV